ncbi:MAG: response regulator [Spirochaetes bacterium]|nr:MAG: response regulator [Spirochaetota bacterium]
MKRTGAKLLIVDDEEIVRLNLRAYLEDQGYAAAVCASGEEALIRMKDERFALCIVDMRLPGMDGNAFIAKAHVLDPSMRYVIHTGSATYVLPETLAAMGIGAGDILKKPLVDLGIVAKTVERLLSTP